MDEGKTNTTKQESEAALHHQKPKKIKIPRREPSVVIPGRRIIYTTADKLTCAECGCFPKDIYKVPQKLNECQQTPLSLYELASRVVDHIPLPTAFTWTSEQVADWMSNVIGLPEYRETIIDNNVNGMRLIMFEDASNLPEINIHSFDDILTITRSIKKLFSLDFVRFCRSIGLPPRYPLTHCTWFKSRTGPNWGIRKNWSRSDILLWMKILMPAPVHRDHWDLVWYEKPAFPKLMFARIPKATPTTVPHYKPPFELDICREYQVPRKFKFQMDIQEDAHLIWMEHPVEPSPKTDTEKPKPPKRVHVVPIDSRLYPKKINLAGLLGKDLVLARRKMNKPKFFA